MGICTDKSINHLKSLGLNVVLHPREGIVPLALLGEFKKERGLIGTLDQLVEPTTAPLPAVTTAVAANIEGKSTSRLPISVGLNILGNVIGALGGNLGVKAAYEGARTIEFAYAKVRRHRANVIAIGDYLSASEILWEHPILGKYLFGKGNLYVLTEVVTSPSLHVTAFRKDGTSLGVEVPAIQGLVGGAVTVGRENEQTNTVSFEGQQELAFGFVAIELSAGDRDEDGHFDLVIRPAEAGSTALSFGAPSVRRADFEGPLDELPDADPDALGDDAQAA